MNVDQTNTSVLNADVKTVPLGAALPLLSPLASSTTLTRGNSLDQSALATVTAVNVSTAASVVSAASAPQKKGGGLAKIQADKKKIDARKKSLKRL